MATNDVILVPSEVTENVSSITERVSAIAITDEQSLTIATDLLAEIKDVKDQTESARDFLVRPLNEQVKKINEVFKPRREDLESATVDLKSKMVVYQQQARVAAEEAQRKLDEDRKREEEERQLEEFLTEEPSEEPVAAPVSVAPPPNNRIATVGGSQFKKRWDYEVTDINKVPRQYLELNKDAARKAVNKGAREISGLRIFEIEDVSLVR